MEKLLALEYRFLIGADGKRSMALDGKASRTNCISGEGKSVRKKATGMTTNRAMPGIVCAE
jgi:hypothetical protein